MVESERTGVSRREILKKMGVGAAVAWTAPIVTSWGTPAYAQTTTVSPAACPPWDCGTTIVGCGEAAPETQAPASPICVCDIDTEGQPVCWNDFFCDNTVTCTTSADCPPGWRCTSNCCGQTCVPPCGTYPTAPPGTNVEQRVFSTTGSRTASGLS